jgi:LuxR family maltose regulon positive regulatory protein
LILAALSGMAQVQVWRARLHEAAEICRQGLEIAREAALQNNHTIPAAAYVRLAQTRLLQEWNQLDEAATSLAEGSALIQRWQMGDVLCENFIHQARLKQARGDVTGALDTLEQAAQLAPIYQDIPRHGGPVAACRARLMLAQAQATEHADRHDCVDAAQKWAETRGLTVDAPITSMNDEYEYVSLARLLVIRDEPDRALRLLDHMLQTAEDGERTGRVIEIHMLQALAYQAVGDIERALDLLEKALTQAEPEGYIRLFIDEGVPMITLLRQAGRQGICTGYVNQLLSAAATTKAIEAETSPQVDPLSERELEILRLIALGYSNTEIAQELVVAIGTVKSHTGNIYAKLGVRSRTKAVARARELNLL